MAFFDDKEEVLEIQLTPYGKRKLSQGKLRPAFYSFGDQDIVYDTFYMAGSLTESHNDAQDRIFDKTPRLKPQAVFSGLQTEFEKLIKIYNNNHDDNFQPFYQSEVDRTFSTITSLGTSRMSDENFPAWKVTMLDGAITGSYDNITGSAPNVSIPQIDLKNVEYFVNFLKGVPEDVTEQLGTIGTIVDEERIEFIEPDTLIEVQDGHVVIQIDELNSIFQNDNFEMELFEIEYTNSKMSLNGVVQQRYELTPLYFYEDENKIQEGDIYIEPGNDFYYSEPEIDSTMADYFLNIEVDSEIDSSLLCKLIPRDKRKGIYDLRISECDEQARVPLHIKSIYKTSVTNEDLEDPC